MAEFFRQQTELPTSSSTSTELYESCPLCLRKTTSLTCQSCIIQGGFTYTKGKNTKSSYCEMLRKFENLKRLKLAFQTRVLEVLEKRRTLDQLADDILIKKEKIQFLHQVLHRVQEPYNLETHLLKSLRDSNSLKQKQSTMNQEKLKRMAQLRQQYQVKATDDKQCLLNLHKKLCELRQSSIGSIQHYLFPVVAIPVYPVMGTPTSQPISHQLDPFKDIEVGDDQVNESVESALAEATRTSYVKGHWVSQEEDVRIDYSIVESTCTLHSNGDYSDYCNWVKAHRNGTRGPDEDIGLGNPAFTISATLTHTAQFLELLAYYFDVILPKRLSYSEFCHNELSKAEFRSSVSRLNANVLHLCFSQHVDPTLLHPDRTLHNLYALLNSSSIGRVGSFECHSELLLTDRENNDDQSDCESDVEDANSESDTEWETLPKYIEIPEDSPMNSSLGKSDSMCAQVLEGEHDGDLEIPTTTSLVSSAAASVAALWPWKR